MEFGGACLWFDTSIVFRRHYARLVDKFVYQRGSAFVFYGEGYSLNVLC